jgi:hypothetical protein
MVGTIVHEPTGAVQGNWRLCCSELQVEAGCFWPQIF